MDNRPLGEGQGPSKKTHGLIPKKLRSKPTTIKENIAKEIASLKKRIQLTEGERKAIYELNEKAIKTNEANIKELRRKAVDLKNQNKSWKKRSPKDFIYWSIVEKVGTANSAQFKDKNYSQVIDILECNIGSFKNKINLNKYRKCRLLPRLNQLLKDEQELSQILAKPKIPKIPTREPKLARIETEISTMEIKIIETKNIAARYDEMITLLKNENKAREKDIQVHETQIEAAIREENRMKENLKYAIKALQQSEAVLSKTEKDAIKEYTDRETNLMESRMYLKELNEKVEVMGGKLTYPKLQMVHRDSSVLEDLSSPFLLAGSQQLETKNEAQVLEFVYNELANMIGEPSPKEIVVKFLEQRERGVGLKVEEDQMKSCVRKSKLHKHFLEDKMNQLQFSGGIHREELNVTSSKIERAIEAASAEREETFRQLNKSQTALEEVCNKLEEIARANIIKYSSRNSAVEESQSNIPLAATISLKILNRIMQILEEILEGDMSKALVSAPISPKEQQLGLGTKNSMYDNLAIGQIPGSPDINIKSVTPPMQNLDQVPQSSSIGENDEEKLLTPDMLGPRSPSFAGSAMALDQLGVAKFTIGKETNSSDEEEATTRAVVKRQAKVIYDSRMRRGKFNAAAGIALRQRKF